MYVCTSMYVSRCLLVFASQWGCGAAGPGPGRAGQLCDYGGR